MLKSMPISSPCLLQAYTQPLPKLNACLLCAEAQSFPSLLPSNAYVHTQPISSSCLYLCPCQCPSPPHASLHPFFVPCPFPPHAMCTSTFSPHHACAHACVHPLPMPRPWSSLTHFDVILMPSLCPSSHHAYAMTMSCLTAPYVHDMPMSISIPDT